MDVPGNVYRLSHVRLTNPMIFSSFYLIVALYYSCYGCCNKLQFIEHEIKRKEEESKRQQHVRLRKGIFSSIFHM